jgi:hypothetical protein
MKIDIQYICTWGEKKGRIYLQPSGDGAAINNLLMLIPDDYPEVIIRC